MTAQVLHTGYVRRIFFDKGYGFLSSDRDSDVFFHSKETANFDLLREGVKVQFELTTGRDGRARATNVERK